MIGANMKKNKQFKKAKHLISDIVDSYILDKNLTSKMIARNVKRFSKH